MKPINMDYAAATPVDPRVFEAMQPYFAEHYGNPSSGHDLANRPREALGEARERLSNLLGATPGEIYFTSCASESNNMAIKGVAGAQRRKGNHIIASAVDHFSVLNPLKTLKNAGFEITLLPVDRYGLVDPDQLARSISPQTILVSISMANPEIGTLQPIEALARIARERGVTFHTDAAAAVGRVPVNVAELDVDLLTFSGDQFYGPKGSAGLYIRRQTRILPLIEGGIQERGRRAGAENIPAIVGLGEAARLAAEEMKDRQDKSSAVRDELRRSLFQSIPHLHLNGHPTLRLPHNLHVSVEFVEGEAMLMHLAMAGVYVSSGSTCASQALKSSHVLEATGLSPALSQGSLLFTMGKENTVEQVPYVTEQLSRIAGALRQMSPLYWEHLKEGHR